MSTEKLKNAVNKIDNWKKRVILIKRFTSKQIGGAGMGQDVTVENVITLFMKIRKVYADEFSRMFQKDGYSPNEISILLFLSNNPSIDTNSQLCTCLGVSKALVCRSVDALLTKEMIVTAADDRDRRVQHLKLTERALPVIEQIRKIKKEIDREILEGIPEDEIRVMRNTMEQIFTRFEERAKEKGVTET